MANAKYHPFNNPDFEEAERQYLWGHSEPFNHPEVEAGLLRMDLTDCIKQSDIEKARTKLNMLTCWTQFAKLSVLAMIIFYTVTMVIILGPHIMKGIAQ